MELVQCREYAASFGCLFIVVKFLHFYVSSSVLQANSSINHKQKEDLLVEIILSLCPPPHHFI